MPSEYSVLDNRPLDQWKVTELKEELKRRKLTTKGLKEELVRRLDEAVRRERELLNQKELETAEDPEPDQHEKHEDKESNSTDICQPIPVEICQPNPTQDGQPNETEVSQVEERNSAAADLERKETENEVTMFDINVVSKDDGQGTEVHKELMGSADMDGSPDETTAPPALMEDINCLVEPIPSEPEANNENLNDDIENRDSKPPVEDVSEAEPTPVKPEVNVEDIKDSMISRDSELPAEDTTSLPSEPEIQVSEVSNDVGFQVKSESISTDSITINEKVELKNDLNANDFHLEVKVDKSEMVQPSSDDVVPVAGGFNPLDNDREPEDAHVSVEEIDEVTIASTLDLTAKVDNSIGGSPEKLNLDRSSGEESMEEDVLETKQSESVNDFDEVGDSKEVRELHVVKEGTPIDDMVGGHSPDKKDIVAEESRNVVPTEKRKLEDQGPAGATEPIKRQRRWNAETIKVPEPQTSNQTPSTTPKDILQSTPRRIFTRSDSGLSADSPKERFVPPSQRTATTSLRIDRFLRPFTLKAVQELLAKTGAVCSFWMDHIKTHCYVTYSSVDEAIATRNALYNLQWPPNGGRLLTADFVDPQEVKTHLEAPQSPAPVAPAAVPLPSPAPLVDRANLPQPAPLQPNHRLQQQVPPLPQPTPPLPQPPTVRERERERPPLPPPPPLPSPVSKKPEPPILTLDDLFKKTRATPRIYYLPLSEEQVAAKVVAQGKGASNVARMQLA